MKTTVSNQMNTFQILIDRESSIEDLKDWNSLITEVLMLVKEKVCLITLSPQSYSFGYELVNWQTFQRNGVEYLINWEISVTKEFVDLVSDSEEFKRGLLLIIISDKISDVFQVIDQLDSVGSIEFNNITTQMIVLEDDGERLIWNYPSKEVQTILSQIK